MKIAITGLSGLLGTNAALLLSRTEDVSGCYRDHRVTILGVSAQRVDVTDPEAMAGWLSLIQPDIVWHTAGLTNVDACEAHPDLARQLNVDAAAIVARASASVGARLIHVSTDHLFSGKVGRYREDATIAPLNVYAATKAEAEERVLAAHPGALVVRTNFFGWGHPHRRSFSDWVLDSLRRHQSISMFTDVFFTPILVNDLVTTAMELLKSGSSGIYNVAGSERVSKFDFGVGLARQFGFDVAAIVPRSVESFSYTARRPRDMSLDVTKAAVALGRPLPDIRRSVEALKELESLGWPERVASAVGPAER